MDITDLENEMVELLGNETQAALKDIAGATGISFSTLQRIRLGSCDPRLSAVKSLAAYYGLGHNDQVTTEKVKS